MLLSCVKVIEWMQPGGTGLLRLWMLQVIGACVGVPNIRGPYLVELTDNDVGGAVSLISFVLRCSQSPYELQDAAGRCLVDLTAADSVFLNAVDCEAYENVQIAKLTTMLWLFAINNKYS